MSLSSYGGVGSRGSGGLLGECTAVVDAAVSGEGYMTFPVSNNATRYDTDNSNS